MYTAQLHKRRSRTASAVHDYPASFYCTLSDQTRTLIIIIIIIYLEILGAHLHAHAHTPGHIYPGKNANAILLPAPRRTHARPRCRAYHSAGKKWVFVILTGKPGQSTAPCVSLTGRRPTVPGVLIAGIFWNVNGSGCFVFLIGIFPAWYIVLDNIQRTGLDSGAHILGQGGRNGNLLILAQRPELIRC